MSKLMIGTDQGILTISPEGKVFTQTDGPPSVGWIAQGAGCTYALTNQGALWKENGDWRLVNERPVDEEVWSFGSDHRIEGRVYIGVGPAMLYISDDGGQTWKDCASIVNIKEEICD